MESEEEYLNEFGRPEKTEQTRQDKQKRITLEWAAFWLFSAIVADALSLIPFVGVISGPVFWALFSFYLWKVGCGFINPRRLITGSISMVVEILPAVQMLPAATLGFILVYIFVRMEEKTGISINNISSGKVLAGSRPLNTNGTRMPTRRPPPLNVDGVRPPV